MTWHGQLQVSSNPMEANLKLEKLNAAEMNATEYQQLIGSLMYGSIGTQFNITHDVGVLSQSYTWQSTSHSCEMSISLPPRSD